MKKLNDNSEEINSLKQEIAGEICFSDNPGNTFKKWQNIFEITQLSLARHMQITSSTISEYQNNKRNNPSINFIKRFINTLIEIDSKRNFQITKKLIKVKEELIFELKEFKKGLKLKNLDINKDIIPINLKDANIIYGITYINFTNLTDISQEEIPKIYGKTNKRILFIYNVDNLQIIKLFIQLLKQNTNLYPALLLLNTTLDETQVKELDLNIPLFITLKNKDEIKMTIEKNIKE